MQDRLRAAQQLRQSSCTTAGHQQSKCVSVLACGASGLLAGATAMTRGEFVLFPLLLLALLALHAGWRRAHAPGMVFNAFFGFTVVLGYKYSWQEALAAVFCSGVIFFLISVFRIREYVINAIPKNLKLAISAGVGLFRSEFLIVAGGFAASKNAAAAVLIIAVTVAFRLTGSSSAIAPKKSPLATVAIAARSQNVPLVPIIERGAKRRISSATGASTEVMSCRSRRRSVPDGGALATSSAVSRATPRRTLGANDCPLYKSASPRGP